MSTFLVDIFTQYGVAILGAIGTLTTIIGGYAVKALLGYTSNTWLRMFTDRMAIEAKNAVLEVQQTYIDELAKGRADGILTKEEAATARSAAILTLKSNLGVKGLRRIAHAFGLDDPAIDRLLGTHVEAAVQRLAIVKSGQMPAVPATPSHQPLGDESVPPLGSTR